MARRASVFLVCFVAAASIASCSLFTSLSGFSNGDDGSTDKDGSTSSSSSSGSPLVDGGLGDASDGGISPIPGDAAFCPSRAGAGAGVVFCSDFDRIGKLTDDWTLEDVEPDSTVALDQNRSISTPRAFRAAMPAKGGGTYYALVSKQIRNIPARKPVRLELDVFLTQPNWGAAGNVSLFSVGYYGPDNEQTDVNQELFIGVGNSTTLTTRIKRPEPNVLEFTAASQAFPRNEWVHVKVESDFKANGGGYIRIWFGATLAIEKTNITFENAPHEFLFVNIGFSRYNNGNTPAFEAFYDNVVLELF